MGETLFELLFKHRPLVFGQGELAFGAPPGWVLALAGILLGGASRLALAGVRVSLLAVLLVLLARPVLLVSTVVPQENFLAVLVDDSRSMRIDDDGSRAAFVHENFVASLTGVVLVTDGADQAPDELDAALLPLRAAGVPVFTVGVGSEGVRPGRRARGGEAPGPGAGRVGRAGRGGAHVHGHARA